MAAKKNKAKKLCRINNCPRSQLPQNLVLLPISHRRHNYFHHTSSRGTTKTWLSTTRRCDAASQPHQLLQLINHEPISNLDSSTSPKNLHYLDDISCISSLSQRSYWTILKVDTTPPSPTPSLDHVNICSVSMYQEKLVGGDIPTSSLMVSYTYQNSSAYEYVHTYNYRGVRHECATIDPFDAKKRYMEFTSMVSMERKYYALSVQGTIVVMQDVGLRIVITGISTCRGVPSGTWRFFKQYLVEVKGEIYLVFLIHRESLQVVDQVEVFGLDIVRLEWNKVERIQGKTFFLDETFIWSDSVVGKGNCVYFTQGSHKGWWVYDMEASCILPA